MYGRGLSNVAPAQQGKGNIEHYGFSIRLTKMHAPLLTMNAGCSYHARTVTDSHLFYVCVCVKGRAVCHGREADLYEAQAGKPLHAGPGLFQDLFLGAVRLQLL